MWLKFTECYVIVTITKFVECYVAVTITKFVDQCIYHHRNDVIGSITVLISMGSDMTN